MEPSQFIGIASLPLIKNDKIMENKDKKEKEVRNDLIDIDETKPTRTEENIESNPSSTINSKFTKNHSRKHEPLSDGHEPGTTPGTGF